MSSLHKKLPESRDVPLISLSFQERGPCNYFYCEVGHFLKYDRRPVRHNGLGWFQSCPGRTYVWPAQLWLVSSNWSVWDPLRVTVKRCSKRLTCHRFQSQPYRTMLCKCLLFIYKVFCHMIHYCAENLRIYVYLANSLSKSGSVVSKLRASWQTSWFSNRVVIACCRSFITEKSQLGEQTHWYNNLKMYKLYKKVRNYWIFKSI